ncbi:hypothetical protein [Aquimarina mytili]|uniref:Uncharacterized protein n=1 Tax=Aquimarina mytili TaxID=874423 RepID=A0A936ZZP2_9FLAO|nr:hypothetical protein [Aquimarina mytili]MBL0682385.1 hypothetical protein [Aquimarina mytili]
MAKYISVLNSDLNKSYWKAVQWDNSLVSIEANPYYTAGYNMNIAKEEGHQKIKTKTIKEIRTLKSATATIIKLSKTSTDVLKLANNSASKTFVKTLES